MPWDNWYPDCHLWSISNAHVHKTTKEILYTHNSLKRDKDAKAKDFSLLPSSLVLLLMLVLPKGKVFMNLICHSLLSLSVPQNPLSFFFFFPSSLFLYCFYIFFLYIPTVSIGIYKCICIYIYMQLEDYCEKFEKILRGIPFYYLMWGHLTASTWSKDIL